MKAQGPGTPVPGPSRVASKSVEWHPVAEAAIARRERVVAELGEDRPHETRAREDHVGPRGLEADDVAAPPVARIAIPARLRAQVHGWWAPAADIPGFA